MSQIPPYLAHLIRAEGSICTLVGTLLLGSCAVMDWTTDSEPTPYRRIVDGTQMEPITLPRDFHFERGNDPSSMIIAPDDPQKELWIFKAIDDPSRSFSVQPKICCETLGDAYTIKVRNQSFMIGGSEEDEVSRTTEEEQRRLTNLWCNYSKQMRMFANRMLNNATGEDFETTLNTFYRLHQSYLTNFEAVMAEHGYTRYWPKPTHPSRAVTRADDGQDDAASTNASTN